MLFISHRLDEVFEIADRITVFRDGRHISTRPAAEAPHGRAVREMVGRELGDFFVRTRHEPGRRRALRVDGSAGAGVFEDVNFEVRARRGARASPGWSARAAPRSAWPCSASRRPTSGTIELAGEPRDDPFAPARRCAHGIAYLSEDRRQLGLSLPQSVAANITLPVLRRYVNALGLRRRDGRACDGRAVTAQRCRSARRRSTRPSGNLSGGNQQKMMLAKWLNTEPQVLILDEPTRGIDVGAKADVHQLVDELARVGRRR